MKKLVLSVAMFVFVCGGSFVAMAQEPVKTQQPTEQTEGEKPCEEKSEECKSEETAQETLAQEVALKTEIETAE